MTWRVRRVGRTLWSSIRAHSRTSWIAIERTRRAAVAGPIAGDRLDGSGRPTVRDEPHVTGDAFHSLEALRLDRAACAVREPG
jgi:hypothetical protein